MQGLPPPDEKPYEENPKVTDWTSACETGTCLGQALNNMTIAPRTPLVGDWLKSGDLGFIFAARGIGKSWLSMYLAKGMALKVNVGPWQTHQQSRVLYLDGEMAPEDIQLRDHLLGPPTDFIGYLNHEILFQRTGKTMNLADGNFQKAVLRFCLDNGFDVLFVDNLSTLVFGLDENKSLDWEIILPWLLTLRRNHITVVFVHHAGRNNQMRGSSKREDPAFWIIRLDEDYSITEERDGARFISRFTKWRNASALPKTYKWHFLPNGSGDMDIQFKEASPLFLFLHWVDSGLEYCSDIAEEMGVSKGYISRLAKTALKLGRIQINGRKYKPIDE